MFHNYGIIAIEKLVKTLFKKYEITNIILREIVSKYYLYIYVKLYYFKYDSKLLNQNFE